MLLYQQPTLLRSDAHRGLTLAHEAADFSFARHSNSFLLAASEIPEAALHFPIVFVGAEGGPYALAVLVGLADQQNLFVDAQGRWQAGAYVPAFVRRYPFVLLEEAPERFSVGFDAAYAGFGKEGGVPLFTNGGESSELLQHAVGYLESFHREMGATREFANRVAELGLLVPRVVEVSSGPSKAPRTLQGFHAVDPAKLAALSPEQLASLAQGPELGWLYLHLNSLRLVSRLAGRVDSDAAKASFPADTPVAVGALPGTQDKPVSPAPAQAAATKAPAASPRPSGKKSPGAKEAA